MSKREEHAYESQLGIIGRPRDQLLDYPVNVRWEVTRRHPYYLSFWRDAMLYYQNLPGDQPVQTLLRRAAALILGAIGVTAEPVPPTMSFEQLVNADPHPALLSGSVQPMTFRSVVAMLINGLPPAERAAVGSFLMVGGDYEYALPGDGDDRTAQKRKALDQLARLSSAALDSYPEIPLFYLHIAASQRSIARDVEDQVRRWKARRGLGSTKVHTGSLHKYLKVWDLREGWNGGGYVLDREPTFADVARQLGLKSVSIAVNHYRSAFEMITGHSFSPELWWRLFGPLKFNGRLGDPEKIFSAPTRRRLKSPVRRDVPDSVITPKSDQAETSGMVESLSETYDDRKYLDLLLDLEDLIARGLSDEEIAQRLDLPGPQIVGDVRQRLGDLRAI